MVRGRRGLRVRPLTANFSLLAAAARRLTVEEPAPSRGGTPAWPRFSCRSQIVAAIIAPPPYAENAIFAYKMTNYHTHSSYCDGSASPREMVEFALSHGFTTLGFTGHSPLPFENTFSITDYAGYCGEIRSLKSEYAGRLDIRLGLDSTMFRGCWRTSPR